MGYKLTGTHSSSPIHASGAEIFSLGPRVVGCASCFQGLVCTACHQYTAPVRGFFRLPPGCELYVMIPGARMYDPSPIHGSITVSSPLQVSDKSELQRTLYFPGLGWLLSRKLYDEAREGTTEEGKRYGHRLMTLSCKLYQLSALPQPVSATHFPV